MERENKTYSLNTRRHNLVNKCCLRLHCSVCIFSAEKKSKRYCMMSRHVGVVHPGKAMVQNEGALRKHAHAIYRDFFSSIKNIKLTRKILIFLIYLLTTYIVGTR